METLQRAINLDMQIVYSLDDLPVLSSKPWMQNISHPVVGVPIGFIMYANPLDHSTTKQYYLFNHLDFTIHYGEEDNGIYVTQFSAIPRR